LTVLPGSTLCLRTIYNIYRASGFSPSSVPAKKSVQFCLCLKLLFNPVSCGATKHKLWLDCGGKYSGQPVPQPPVLDHPSCRRSTCLQVSQDYVHYSSLASPSGPPFPWKVNMPTGITGFRALVPHPPLLDHPSCRHSTCLQVSQDSMHYIPSASPTEPPFLQTVNMPAGIAGSRALVLQPLLLDHPSVDRQHAYRNHRIPCTISPQPHLLNHLSCRRSTCPPAGIAGLRALFLLSVLYHPSIDCQHVYRYHRILCTCPLASSTGPPFV